MIEVNRDWSTSEWVLIVPDRYWPEFEEFLRRTCLPCLPCRKRQPAKGGVEVRLERALLRTEVEEWIGCFFEDFEDVKVTE